MDSEEASRGYLDENEEMEDEMMGRYPHSALYDLPGGEGQQENLAGYYDQNKMMKIPAKM
jgi:hypothetical protein